MPTLPLNTTRGLHGKRPALLDYVFSSVDVTLVFGRTTAGKSCQLLLTALNGKVTALTRPAINEKLVARAAEVNLGYLVVALATGVIRVIGAARRVHEYVPKVLPEGLLFPVLTR